MRQGYGHLYMYNVVTVISEVPRAELWEHCPCRGRRLGMASTLVDSSRNEVSLSAESDGNCVEDGPGVETRALSG